MIYQELSLKILALVGGKENVLDATCCMTRLRITLKDKSLADAAALKAMDEVLGVVEDVDLQVILGAGKAQRVTDCFKAACGLATPTADPEKTWQEAKTAQQDIRRVSRSQEVMKTFGDIFVPMIPGMVTAGIGSGLAALIAQLWPGYGDVPGLLFVHTLLSMLGSAFMAFIPAWAGYRAAEKFGATPILGGMLGMLSMLEGVDTISQLMSISALEFVMGAGRGGVMAVVLGVWLLAYVEKGIRRRIPEALDIIISPLAAMFLCVIPYVLVIMPVTGVLSDGLLWLLSEICIHENALVRMVGGFLSAGLYLPMMTVGLHHSLPQIYQHQLDLVGHITLYPALAMAGAGQLGAALAIFLKARRVDNRRIRHIIWGTAPVGLLGVGEPLLYGVTLPMGKPFLTAGLGAGIGGAFVMAMGVAATTWGPSGLLALPVMTEGAGGTVMSALYYGLGLVISCVAAFLITAVLVRDDAVANA